MNVELRAGCGPLEVRSRLPFAVNYVHGVDVQKNSSRASTQSWPGTTRRGTVRFNLGPSQSRCVGATVTGETIDS
jgi:hypothetical protein